MPILTPVGLFGIAKDRDLDRLRDKLDHLISFVYTFRRDVMATAQEFRDAFAALRASHANLVADIQRILANQDGGGMTAAEEQELLAELQGVVDEAAAAAAIVPEPEP